MERLLSGAKLLGITLDREKQARFSRYYEILSEWNQWMNLTRITNKDSVAVLHFLDSLTPSIAIPTTILNHGAAIDIGTGPGFPGIPLKIAFPNMRIDLVESSSKKIQFLQHLIDQLQLTGVRTHQGRAETLAHESSMRENFDLVLSRATSKLPTLVEIALPFLRPKGILIAQKRGEIPQELESMGSILPYLGGASPEIIDLCLPGLEDNRFLTVVTKTKVTDMKYPRRPGIPNKRPLDKVIQRLDPDGKSH